jgi:hypothetical protein
MLLLGLILLVVGFLTGISILWTIGITSRLSARFCGSWAPWDTRSPAAGTTGDDG